MLTLYNIKVILILEPDNDELLSSLVERKIMRNFFLSKGEVKLRSDKDFIATECCFECSHDVL